jgi:hypothetical protein
LKRVRELEMLALDRGTLDLFVMPDNSFSEKWILGMEGPEDRRDMRTGGTWDMEKVMGRMIISLPG